jgi:anaerobic selenocysteine-containing dehydrogenase
VGPDQPRPPRPKDLYGWQANNSPDRLTRPLIRAADVHLTVRSGTNLALMNGILREIIRNGWYDEEYVAAQTIGFDELRRVVDGYPPRRVAQICDVPASGVERAAELLGSSQLLLSTVLQGFYESNEATASANE